MAIETYIYEHLTCPSCKNVRTITVQCKSKSEALGIFRDMLHDPCSTCSGISRGQLTPTRNREQCGHYQDEHPSVTPIQCIMSRKQSKVSGWDKILANKIVSTPVTYHASTFTNKNCLLYAVCIGKWKY